MPTVRLCIAGLQSRAEEPALEQALRAVAGVYAAAASYREGCVWVDCDDDEVTLDRLMDVVRQRGYGVQPGG
jgi:copper chaperone CopZ